MKKLNALVAVLLAASMVGCGTATTEGEPATPAPTEDAVVETEAPVEAEASAVGKWHLVKVSSQETPESDILELDPTENASLYAEGDGYIELAEDGTGKRVMVDGEDETDVALSWTAAENVYTIVEGDVATDYTFDAETETLVRKAEDETFGELTFVYIRVEETPEADAEVAPVEETEVEAIEAEAEAVEAEAGTEEAEAPASGN